MITKIKGLFYLNRIKRITLPPHIYKVRYEKWKKINPLNNPDAITASFFANHSWQKVFLARSKKTVAKPSAKAPQRFCRLGYWENSNSTLFGRILAAYLYLSTILVKVSQSDWLTMIRSFFSCLTSRR